MCIFVVTADYGMRKAGSESIFICSILVLYLVAYVNAPCVVAYVLLCVSMLSRCLFFERADSVRAGNTHGS